MRLEGFIASGRQNRHERRDHPRILHVRRQAITQLRAAEAFARNAPPAERAQAQLPLAAHGDLVKVEGKNSPQNHHKRAQGPEERRELLPVARCVWQVEDVDNPAFAAIGAPVLHLQVEPELVVAYLDHTAEAHTVPGPGGWAAGAGGASEGKGKQKRKGGMT